MTQNTLKYRQKTKFSYKFLSLLLLLMSPNTSQLQNDRITNGWLPLGRPSPLSQIPYRPRTLFHFDGTDLSSSIYELDEF